MSLLRRAILARLGLSRWYRSEGAYAPFANCEEPRWLSLVARLVWPLGLGAIEAESVPAANMQGHLMPLSGTNASSDKRQKLSRRPLILAVIAEIGGYFRDRTGRRRGRRLG